jgi:ArsR family transcriptional regulator
MSKTLGKERVERLLESGLCESKDPDKYIRELKELVEQINEDTIKRQSYLLKALADSTRIKILRLLKHRPMCTCEIMVALDLTEPNASHHLNLLERNGLVTSERMGKWTFYKPKNSTIKNLLDIITA